MKRSAGTRWPPAVREHVAEHQPRCIGPLAGMPGECSWGSELDHVRVGGMGMQVQVHRHERRSALSGASRPQRHARGKIWRPKLLQVIAHLHGECAQCQRESIERWGVPLEEVAR